MTGANASEDKIRLLLVDDHALFRDGLVRLLSNQAGMEVVAQVDTIAEGLGCLAKMPVDMVLLDLELREESGMDFLPQARRLGFGGKVLVVAAEVTAKQARELAVAGVSGFYLKTDSPAGLVQQIRQVQSGSFSIDQRMLLSMLDPSPAESGPRLLTAKERQILILVVEGKSNKEIADSMECSEAAVKGILQQLFNKTGVRTRGQLVRVALERYADELEWEH